tara:strand:+ start:4642 stop:5607 length:966 start_codon:yes stop_codon:yes gene_type:complete
MIIKKNILVTGGAGFLGSHLIDLLIRDGNHVTCLDNLYTGHLNNIEHLKSNNLFRFVEGDVCNEINIDNIEEIYNLACPASPVHYQHDPIFTTRTNILGALNVLDLAKKNNAKVFQASTSEVYGDPKVHPQVESYWGNVNPIGIRSCYDEGKRCAETLFFDHQRMHGTDIRVVRIFNTYGPRMDQLDGRVVSNFITQALRDEDITLYGDGLQTRSFCYVDDLVRGFHNLMNLDKDILLKNNLGPMNLGNPDEFTMVELADMVIDLIGSKSKKVYQDLPQDDPLKRKPNIDLAEKYLNWTPDIKLVKGLESTIKYFDNLIGK